MKKIIISIIILSIFIIAKVDAQTNYTPTGTWRCVNGNDTIQFFFNTSTIIIGDDNMPIIYGFHKYVKNGQIVENNLINSNSTYSQNLFSVVIFNDTQISFNPRLDGHFKDITLNGKRAIMLKRINPTTMTINLSYLQGVRRNGNEQGFTLPKSFTLHKL
jgi:hypothetical protein